MKTQIDLNAEMAFQKLMEANLAEGRLRGLIIDRKTESPNIRFRSLTTSEQSEFAALEIESQGDIKEDLLIDSLICNREVVTRAILNYMKHESDNNAIDLANTIKIAVINERRDELEKLIEKTEVNCCGHCEGYLDHEELRCYCEIGKCDNCYEEMEDAA